MGWHGWWQAWSASQSSDFTHISVRALEVSAQNWVPARRKGVLWGEEEGEAGDRLETAVVQAGGDGDQSWVGAGEA